MYLHETMGVVFSADEICDDCPICGESCPVAATLQELQPGLDLAVRDCPYLSSTGQRGEKVSESTVSPRI